MLIVCNGMIRSGSTLQYNLIRLQVEATLSGKAEGFVGKKELRSERLKFWQIDEALHVIKSHDILPEWMRAEGIKLVYIYRDIRDVAVSLKNKTGSKGDRLLASLDRAIEHFHIIKGAKNVLWQRYENVRENIIFAAREQAEFLGLNIEEEIFARIIQKCEITGASELTEGLNTAITTRFKFLLRKFGLCGAIYDEKTLLHPNHISKHKGAVGVWEKELSSEEINLINGRYEEWLRDQEYIR